MGERINNFLNKKPWHPSSFQNQEKVWIAEQAAEKEAEQLRIRMEEIRHEKAAEELRTVGRGGWVKAMEDRDAKFERAGGDKASERDLLERVRSASGDGAAAAKKQGPKPAAAQEAAEAKRKAENYAKAQKRKERKKRKLAAEQEAEAAAEATAPPEAPPATPFSNDGSFLEQARRALLAKGDGDREK